MAAAEMPEAESAACCESDAEAEIAELQVVQTESLALLHHLMLLPTWAHVSKGHAHHHMWPLRVSWGQPLCPTGAHSQRPLLPGLLHQTQGLGVAESPSAQVHVHLQPVHQKVGGMRG